MGKAQDRCHPSKRAASSGLSRPAPWPTHLPTAHRRQLRPHPLPAATLCCLALTPTPSPSHPLVSAPGSPASRMSPFSCWALPHPQGHIQSSAISVSPSPSPVLNSNRIDIPLTASGGGGGTLGVPNAFTVCQRVAKSHRQRKLPIYFSPRWAPFPVEGPTSSHRLAAPGPSC